MSADETKLAAANNACQPRTVSQPMRYESMSVGRGAIRSIPVI